MHTILIEKYVQSVHVAHSMRVALIGKYVQDVHIVRIMRAALIGKYAAPWSEGQFALQRHLPTKHCSNTTEMQIQNNENTSMCMCIHIYVHARKPW